MKIKIILSVLVLLHSCVLFDSPGTLGSAGEHEFACSSSEIDFALGQLEEVDSYKMNASDSIAVAWWNEVGYDFLDHKCITINKRLYMITLDSDESTSSSLSIRAFYNRKEKEWKVAKEFNAVENFAAEKALEQLVDVLPKCE